MIASVWIWISILRFYSTKPGMELNSRSGEILAVLTFLTVYSATEITSSFYSVGWMVMAPIFAYAQLRAQRASRETYPGARRLVRLSPVAIHERRKRPVARQQSQPDRATSLGRNQFR